MMKRSVVFVIVVVIVLAALFTSFYLIENTTYTSSSTLSGRVISQHIHDLPFIIRCTNLDTNQENWAEVPENGYFSLTEPSFSNGDSYMITLYSMMELGGSSSSRRTPNFHIIYKNNIGYFDTISPNNIEVEIVSQSQNLVTV